MLADAITAAADALMDEAGGPAWDEAGFARLRAHVAGGLLDTASNVLAQIVRILGVKREVERLLDGDLAAGARARQARRRAPAGPPGAAGLRDLGPALGG